MVLLMMSITSIQHCTPMFGYVKHCTGLMVGENNYRINLSNALYAIHSFGNTILPCDIESNGLLVGIFFSISHSYYAILGPCGGN